MKRIVSILSFAVVALQSATASAAAELGGGSSEPSPNQIVVSADRLSSSFASYGAVQVNLGSLNVGGTPIAGTGTGGLGSGLAALGALDFSVVTIQAQAQAELDKKLPSDDKYNDQTPEARAQRAVDKQLAVYQVTNEYLALPKDQQTTQNLERIASAKADQFLGDHPTIIVVNGSVPAPPPVLNTSTTSPTAPQLTIVVTAQRQADCIKASPTITSGKAQLDSTGAQMALVGVDHEANAGMLDKVYQNLAGSTGKTCVAVEAPNESLAGAYSEIVDYANQNGIQVGYVDSVLGELFNSASLKSASDQWRLAALGGGAPTDASIFASAISMLTDRTSSFSALAVGNFNRRNAAMAQNLKNLAASGCNRVVAFVGQAHVSHEYADTANQLALQDYMGGGSVVIDIKGLGQTCPKGN